MQYTAPEVRDPHRDSIMNGYCRAVCLKRWQPCVVVAIYIATLHAWAVRRHITKQTLDLRHIQVATKSQVQAASETQVTTTIASERQVSTGPVEVAIAIENDTPYEIDDLVLIHKYLGLPSSEPSTHVALWQNVKAKAVSSRQKVITEVGGGAMSVDWWLLSWRFKRGAGPRCPCCVKEDSSCETWISDPNNALGQFFVDPVTYVKLGSTIINGVVAGLSLGTAAIVSVAATTLLTDIVVDALTADRNKDGFKGCSLHSIDFNNSEGGRPVQIRITQHFKEDDYVTWVGHDDDIPEGTVGRIVGFKDEDPIHRSNIRVEFPGKKGPVVWKFSTSSLKFTFRPGDIVSKRGDSSGGIGQVIGYWKGMIGVLFGVKERYYKANMLVAQPAPNNDKPSSQTPQFKVDIMLYKEGTRVAEKGVGPSSDHVRWHCDMKAKAMPCVVNSPSPDGKEVPITVVNQGSRSINSFAVLHKYNGLDPSVHIVDMEEPLPVGASSWLKPRRDSVHLKHSGSFCDGSKILAHSGSDLLHCRNLVQHDLDCRELFHTNEDECLCVRAGNDCNVKPSKIGNNIYSMTDDSIPGKWLVAKDDVPIFASVASKSKIGTLKKGDMVTAAGSRSKNGAGKVLVPIVPHGVVEWKYMDVLDHPDPSAVRTDTGFGFHNDWWTLAWTYGGDLEDACEVHTAMDMDFLDDLISNPHQKLLNIAVGVADYALGVPVLWAGAIGLGKYSVEKYVRNQNNITGADTKPAYKLFGIRLLQLLASSSSVRGYRKCNLARKDVENGQRGKPVEIIIRDDHIEIKADGGENSCLLEIAEMSCLHTPECFETETCKKLNARTNFAKPAAVGG